MMSADHSRGIFFRQSQFQDWELERNDFFMRLRKPFWLGSRFGLGSRGDAEDLTVPLSRRQTKNELERHFASTDRPILLSQMTRHGETWSELARVFVVSDQWPMCE
jgi:hypothetical protein